MPLFAALSAILVLAIAGPASAHTGFESSVPADGATVDVAIDELTIAFSGAAEPAGEGFVVLDPSGTIRTPDTVSADAEQLRWTLGFDPPLTDGVVGVRWTVQAPDAHPISGSFSFTVTATAPTASDTDTDSGSLQPLPATPAPGTEAADTDASVEVNSSEAVAAGVAPAKARGDDADPEGSGLTSEQTDLDAFLQPT
ncbi:MAG: copper resistance CopC family protein, partial [Actinomycetota bacterium]